MKVSQSPQVETIPGDLSEHAPSCPLCPALRRRILDADVRQQRGQAQRLSMMIQRVLEERTGRGRAAMHAAESVKVFHYPATVGDRGVNARPDGQRAQQGIIPGGQQPLQAIGSIGPQPDERPAQAVLPEPEPRLQLVRVAVRAAAQIGDQLVGHGGQVNFRWSRGESRMKVDIVPPPAFGDHQR